MKKRLGYSRKSRLFAVILTFLLLFGIVAGLMALAIYSISTQIKGEGVTSIHHLLTEYLQSFILSLQEIDNTLSGLHLGDGFFMQNFEEARRELSFHVHNFMGSLMTTTMNASGMLLKLGLGIVLSIYFLIDKNTFVLYGNIIGKIFFKDSTYQRVKRWYHDVDRIFSGYVRGQTADVIFMAVSISVLLGIIGIRYGILIGCIAGICNYIPYAGPFVAYVGTIGFGLLNGQEKQVLIALIFLFILQQIDGNYVGPKMMARSVAIEPVFVLMGVIVGGSILGFVGMILAVPITALIKLMFVRFLERKLIKLEGKNSE